MQWPKQRAWGWYATLIRTPWFCLKLLRFKPNGKLSFQVHQYRNEWWFFLRCKICSITNDQKIYDERYTFETWFIPKKTFHQLINWNRPIYILELQYGKKVTESDIERK